MKTSFRCAQTVPCRTHAQAQRFRDRLGQYRSHITDLRYKYALVGGAPSNNSLPNSDRQTNDTKKKKKKSPFISKSEKYDDKGSSSFLRISSLSLSTTSMAMTIRVFFLALLLLASPFLLQVVRCESASDQVEAAEVVEESLSDLGYVADADQDDQVFSDENFGPAPGVETVCVFPKNSKKLVPAGEDSELLVGLKNEGESVLNVIALRASLHLPFDHHLLVQNLTTQQFNNASVPLSAQATFPYHFAVSKYLQPGTFDLVGTIIYEINQQAYQSTFYNGTIEVVEASGFLSIESVFLVTLGAGLLGFLILWVYGQIQNFSKKTKRVQKVEVGTGTTDSNLDEWLKGTAYAQANKSKKKK